MGIYRVAGLPWRTDWALPLPAEERVPDAECVQFAVGDLVLAFLVIGFPPAVGGAFVRQMSETGMGGVVGELWFVTSCLVFVVLVYQIYGQCLIIHRNTLYEASYHTGYIIVQYRLDRMMW